MGDLKTYDSNQVIVIVGVSPISGFAEGSRVTVRRNADTWATVVGSDGEGTRSKSNDKSGEIEIELMQSSDSNDYLSALLAADEATGAGVVPAQVQDLSGRSLHVAEKAFVRAYPEAAYGAAAGPRTWIIWCPELVNFLGGAATAEVA